MVITAVNIDLVETILAQAAQDKAATSGVDFKVYEIHKRRIGFLDLPCDEYEDAIKRLAAVLGI